MNRFFAWLLSEKVKSGTEATIIAVAIISFILHLAVIALVHLGILRLDDHSMMFTNPIAAIYTPFSFILIYEVYLLVYYLPKSTTIYIGKQYEIITLIVIRNLFKDLANLEFTDDWFHVESDLQFTYDLLATILLFFMIYLFYWLNRRRDCNQNTDMLGEDMKRFIRLKKMIATGLIPVFVVLGIYGFSKWLHGSFFTFAQAVGSLKHVNSIFFDDFFTVLILTDVLLLLISFLYSDKFSIVIRNSGFIISTILIKLSFGAEGLLNTILIVAAVFFGISMLVIHNQFEKLKT